MNSMVVHLILGRFYETPAWFVLRTIVLDRHCAIVYRLVRPLQILGSKPPEIGASESN